jgi:hypothetical protein
MSNFVYNNTALPAAKTDIVPVSDPTRQWSATDSNFVFQALGDIRTAIGNQAVNVLAFGATGNGSTDDTAAIQAAINATAGRTLYIPKGKYKVTSTLFITNTSHHLVGDFGNRNVDGGTEISFTGTGPCIQIGVDNGHAWDLGDYNGPQDQRFENLWISHASPDANLVSAGNPGALHYKVGAYGIWDWRGGGIGLQNVGIEHFEANFVGINSDINNFNYVISLYSRYGIYAGPRSDQFSIRDLYSFFCDRAVTIDRASQVRIVDAQIVGCGTPTSSAIEVRQASTSPRMERVWFEHLQGYSGTDQQSFVSIGEVAGYGPGGSISSPGGTPTTSPVEGATVLRPFVYTVLPGLACHTKYLISVGKCHQLVLDHPVMMINSSLNNFDALVGIQAGQSPSSSDTQICISNVPSVLTFAKCFTNAGGGSPTVVVQSWGASGTRILDNVTLGAATTAVHTINGAVTVNPPLAATSQAFGVINSNSGQTTAAITIRGRQDGSIDTTSGAQFPVSVLAQALSTKSSGTNLLRNIGLQTSAQFGDDNRAIETLSGDNVFNITSGATICARSFRLASELVPPQITANQNDYNPTGLAETAVLLLNSSVAVSITGIAAGGGTGGRILWVFNTGSSNITLSNQNASSTAVNRIIGRGNADTILTAGTGCFLYYSPSLARWIIMSDSL